MNTPNRTRAGLLAALLSLPILSATGCAFEDGESLDVAEETTEVGVRAHFDLFEGTDGQYYFDLSAGNGQVMLWSEGYQSRTGALNGILSVLDNGGLESRYTVTEGADGQFYVNLKARNGQIIAQGEGYSTASNAQRAVRTNIGAIANYLAYWNDHTGERFEVFEGKDGRFYFRLFAGNGAQVLRSQGYSSEAAALNGAFAVAEYGTDEAAYDVRESSNGFYFNVRAPNNEVIGTSQIYSTRSNAERGRNAIIALLPTVELL